MKRNALALILMCLLPVVLASCTSWQEAASDVPVRGGDVVYLKDERTDLCFAVLYLKNKVGTKVSDMAMTSVPCGKIPAQLAR